jgi:hypothetical protein
MKRWVEQGAGILDIGTNCPFNEPAVEQAVIAVDAAATVFNGGRHLGIGKDQAGRVERYFFVVVSKDAGAFLAAFTQADLEIIAAVIRCFAGYGGAVLHVKMAGCIFIEVKWDRLIGATIKFLEALCFDGVHSLRKGYINQRYESYE